MNKSSRPVQTYIRKYVGPVYARVSERITHIKDWFSKENIEARRLRLDSELFQIMEKSSRAQQERNHGAQIEKF